MGTINISMTDMMSDPVDRAIENNPRSSLSDIGTLGRIQNSANSRDETQSALFSGGEGRTSALPRGPEFAAPLDTFELSQTSLSNFGKATGTEGYSALPKGILGRQSALPQAPEFSPEGGLQGPAFNPLGLDVPAPESAENEDDQEEEESEEGEEAKAAEEQLPGAREDYSEAENREIRELRRADQEVRAHEQAHRSVGGQYIRGGVQYEYKRGPDGKLYAVGGEVSIDVSEVPNDPEATARKMEKVRRAALAPSDPSPQDRLVAAKAASIAAQARAEAAQQRSEELREQQEESGISSDNSGPLGPLLSNTQQIETGQFFDLLF